LTVRREIPEPAATFRPRLFRWGGLLLMVLVVLYAVLGTDGLLRQYQRYRQHGELLDTLAREETENERLRQQVEGLRGEDLAIERAVRTELDFQRPGEIVIITGSDDPLAGQPGFDSPPPAP